MLKLRNSIVVVFFLINTYLVFNISEQTLSVLSVWLLLQLTWLSRKTTC